MKLSISFILTLIIFACEDKPDLSPIACGSEDPATEVQWINELIEEFEISGSSSTIELYSYNNQKVFAISRCDGCPDGLTLVYDCDQNEICKFGGIAGVNTCLDFDEKAILIETIFEK